MDKNIFEINCERLILREFIPEDLEPIYQITLQPEIKKFLPDWVASKEQREIWLHKYEIPENQAFLKSLPVVKDNILRLAIVQKKTNKVIGWIVSGLKEELPVPNREIGYGISNEYAGNGYATEAACGMVKYLLKNTDSEYINAVARVDNLSLNKVIKKSGFSYIGDVEIENYQYHHYKICMDDINE